jgi:hypothetical protein
LIIGLPNISILFALMRHKLSKWPYAELKFPVVSALDCFTYPCVPKTILELAAKKIIEELNLFTVKIKKKNQMTKFRSYLKKIQNCMTNTVISVFQYIVCFPFSNISILFALMRHKLSKWPYAELKFPVVSALDCLTYPCMNSF